MRALQYGLYGLVVGSLFLLSGCTAMEHRSDTIAKQPLSKLPTDKIAPKLVWSNSKSAGVGKTDAKLRLALHDPWVVIADSKGQIFAFDQNTGSVKWQIATKANITAGPTIVDGRVLVGTDGGRVLAYGVSEGSLLWQASVTGPVLAAPQGNQGVIFVHALNGSVTALNASDGSQLWYYTSQSPALMLRRSSSPVVVDNHVMVGFSNGRLMALHRIDGQPDWEREIAVSSGRSDVQRMVDISADPILKDHVLYVVSYQGRLMALNPDTGHPYWEREMSSYSGLAVASHVVYVTDSKGTLWALDRKTGSDLWKTSLIGRHLSAPVVYDGYIVVGDDDGNVHWFSEENGSLKGRIQIDSKGINATPVVKDNRLYVLGRGGKIAVYERGH